MNQTITLSSGASVEMFMAPFETGKALAQALATEAKNIKIEGQIELDIKAALGGTQANLLKDVFCSFIASKEIELLMFKCFEKCLYNKKKLTKDLFELDIDARGDYYELIWEVGKFNVTPFFKNLLSKFSAAMSQINTSIPK